MALTSLRGTGLDIAHNTLYTLAMNPDRIAHERKRFDRSPPPSYSNPSSHNSTAPTSPVDQTNEQRRLEALRWQLKRERDASTPFYQYLAQRDREREWLMEARQRRIIPRLPNGSFDDAAEENVVKDWKRQGIWDDAWHEKSPGIKWKHETPLKPSIERHAALQAQHPPAYRLFEQVEAVRQPTPPSSPIRVTERQKRVHEASRPIHQFTHRLHKEAHRLGLLEGMSCDIYTRAYEAVRKFWTEEGIWDERWRIFPGRSWKHELPFDLELEKCRNGDQTYPEMDAGGYFDDSLLPLAGLGHAMNDDPAAEPPMLIDPDADKNPMLMTIHGSQNFEQVFGYHPRTHIASFPRAVGESTQACAAAEAHSNLPRSTHSQASGDTFEAQYLSGPHSHHLRSMEDQGLPEHPPQSPVAAEIHSNSPRSAHAPAARLFRSFTEASTTSDGPSDHPRSTNAAVPSLLDQSRPASTASETHGLLPHFADAPSSRTIEPLPDAPTMDKVNQDEQVQQEYKRPRQRVQGARVSKAPRKVNPRRGQRASKPHVASRDSAVEHLSNDTQSAGPTASTTPRRSTRLQAQSIKSPITLASKAPTKQSKCKTQKSKKQGRKASNG